VLFIQPRRHLVSNDGALVSAIGERAILGDGNYGKEKLKKVGSFQLLDLVMGWLDV
jgi:hypothetical protein